MDGNDIYKVPPNDVRAEEAFLGCMLFDEEGLSEGLGLLKSDDFYRPNNRVVFEAMQTLFKGGVPVDLITLKDILDKRGEMEVIGGIEYLLNLSNIVSTSANIKSYSTIIEEKSILRKLIQVSGEIQNSSYQGNTEIDTIIENAEKGIFNIVQNRKTSDFSSISNILVQSIDRLEELYKNKNKTTGLTTGFIDFDKKTAGLQKSDLILIAARPSMGKTAFVLNLAQHIAVKEAKSVAIFSLEMAEEQLVNRMLCSEASVDSNKLRTAQLDDSDWNKIANAIKPLSNSKVYIDDTPGITVTELRSKCRKLKMEKGLDLIIIDYLQLMSGGKKIESRQQEVSDISRALKGVAREMEAPVIALSQLSRANEKRPDKRPILSDLRDSGAIEQDADVVAFLHREEYYDPETEDKGIADLIIAKQRNGETGTIKLGWKGEYTRFYNIEYNYD